MDFINKAFAQLRELFLSMPLSSRVIAALLLAVLVVSLGYLFTGQVGGPQMYLLGGEAFSTSQLNSMEAAFAQEGLGAYEIVGGRVRVPHGKQNEYIAALAKHKALPENFGEIINRALDQGSPFEPRDRREQRIKNARQMLLSQIVASLSGVERATVMYDSQTRGGLSKEQVYTAAVVVKPEGNRPLDMELANSIRLLVTASVAGLKPENVAVTDATTGQTTFGESSHYGAALNDPYFARKRLYEEELKGAILQALTMIPGVTVTPYVELDPEQVRQEQQIKHEPKAVEVQSSETTVTKTRETAPPGGRPGIAAQQGSNTPLRLAAGGGAATTEQEEQSERNSVSMVSSSVVTSEKLGLIPKRISVAITVPSSYFQKIWLEQNPPQAGEEAKKPTAADLDAIRTGAIKNIKQLVATVLPRPEGVTDLTELVTVTDFPDLPVPPIPAPGMATQVTTWLMENWRTLGLLALLAFSMVMLRSMVKAAPAAPVVLAQTPQGTPAGEEAAETEGGTTRQRRLQRFQTTGASLRDELTELVSEDPESAANILRNWIGSVSK